MKKNNFDKFQLSHTGRRETNEDRVLIHFNKKREDKQVILAIADGMGGYEKGETAAQIMIEQLKRLNETELSSEFHSLSDEVAKHIKEANRQIVELSEKAGVSQMGTTVTGALINGNRCLFFNVGDSRTYVISSLEIQKITTDHSADMDAFLNGVIGEDEIGKGYYSHALTRCIGTDKEVEVDIFPFAGFHELKDGEIIFSCSDGLWNVVKKEEIYRELIGRASLEDSLEALLALAYAKGSKDNISMIAFEYGRLPRRNLNLKMYPPIGKQGKPNIKKDLQKKKILMPILWGIAIFLFIAVTGLFLLLSLGNKAKKNAFIETKKEPSINQIHNYPPNETKEDNQANVQGGRIEFVQSGTYNGSVDVQLQSEPLKVRGQEIGTEIYYTTDGTNPTKKNGTKYEKMDEIVFNKPGNHIIKAKSIGKVGNYEGEVYSQTYKIQSESRVSKMATVTNSEDLDLIVRKKIFEQTKRILIRVEGISKIEKSEKLEIQLSISSSGRPEVGIISGIIVEPKNKLSEIEKNVREKIRSLEFLPPTRNDISVNAIIWIDFKKIAKSGNKISFLR